MLVLAQMNTVRWQKMDNQQRQAAVQCPCGFEFQNVEHMLSGTCEYTEELLDDMHSTVSAILQSEGESVQQCWILARGIRECMATLVSMDVRTVTPDALWELGLSVKTLVRKVESVLRDINSVSETWPMSVLMWAPEIVGPQIEAMPRMECVQPSIGVLQESAG